MTPGAMARLNAETNRRLTAAIERLAVRAGVEEVLDKMRTFNPSIKSPATALMREREVLAETLEAIADRLSEEREAPDTITPPPSRRHRVPVLPA